MTATVQPWKPLFHWRAWDTDWKCTGEWHNQRPPADKLTEGGMVTVDYANGIRQAWRVVAGELVPEIETLTKLLTWPNPCLPRVVDTSPWKVFPEPLPDWGRIVLHRWLPGDPIRPPIVGIVCESDATPHHPTSDR